MLTISESVPAFSASAGGRAVLGDAVAARAFVGHLRRAGAELGDRRVVALDEAVEAPLALEQVGLQLVVAQPGTPQMALNEHITVSDPASIAALNGGRYRLCSRCSDMSVVL